MTAGLWIAVALGMVLLSVIAHTVGWTRGFDEGVKMWKDHALRRGDELTRERATAFKLARKVDELTKKLARCRKANKKGGKK